jgi:hypothetical protein
MVLSSTYQSTDNPLLSTLYEPLSKHLITVLGLASALGAVYVPERAEERAGRIFTVLYTPATVSCIIPSQRISTPGGGRSDE